jgi:hypothetical protein
LCEFELVNWACSNIDYEQRRLISPDPRNPSTIQQPRRNRVVVGLQDLSGVSQIEIVASKPYQYRYQSGGNGDGSSQDTTRDRVVESSGVREGRGSGGGDGAIGAIKDVSRYSLSSMKAAEIAYPLVTAAAEATRAARARKTCLNCILIGVWVLCGWVVAGVDRNDLLEVDA